MEKRWIKVAKQVDQMQDGLGLPVDEGIKETVIALNILGFKTCGSCQGHFERAIAAPWVDINAEIPRELWHKMHMAFDKADKAAKANKSEEELDNLYKTVHSLRLETRKPVLEEAKEITAYLVEFYQDRKVSYDTRLTIEPLASFCRIESTGAYLQDIADQETKRKNLKQYQSEMRAFTDFLKNIYIFKADVKK